jgi:endonuclease/exonuclease/phosphatase (EEP) superfamily protein YafD
VLLSLPLIAFVACSACSGTALRASRSPGQGQATLAVMTYNLNYGLAGDEETLRAIEAQPVDLVLLQETNEAWEAALRARLGARYPNQAFRHCCGAGGLGVLARQPFRELAYLEPPSGGWFPAWALELQSPLGRVQVLSIHLRPQLGDSGPNVRGVLSGMITTPAIRRQEIAQHLTHLRRGIPTLIAGDFNEAEDGSLFDYLAERGFRSALPEFSHADTWRWRAGLLGTVSRRFDHIVYGQGLDPLAARVVHAGRSDHLPVIAVFERD